MQAGVVIGRHGIVDFILFVLLFPALTGVSTCTGKRLGKKIAEEAVDEVSKEKEIKKNNRQWIAFYLPFILTHESR